MMYHLDGRSTVNRWCILASRRPSELAYRHTRTHLVSAALLFAESAGYRDETTRSHTARVEASANW